MTKPKGVPVRKIRKSGNPNPQGNKGKGRPKGCLNKIPKALKETILGSLDQAGGVDYLARQAEENPQAYLTLLGKVLPQDVNATVSTKPWTPEQAEAAVQEAISAAKQRP